MRRLYVHEYLSTLADGLFFRQDPYGTADGHHTGRGQLSAEERSGRYEAFSRLFNVGLETRVRAVEIEPILLSFLCVICSGHAEDALRQLRREPPARGQRLSSKELGDRGLPKVPNAHPVFFLTNQSPMMFDALSRVLSKQHGEFGEKV